MSKKTTNYKIGDKIDSKSLSNNQIIYLDGSSFVNEPIIVETSNNEVVKIISRFKKMKKLELCCLTETIIKSIKNRNMKEEYAKFESGITKDFDDICSDILLIACANHVLTGKLLPISLNMKFSDKHKVHPNIIKNKP